MRRLLLPLFSLLLLFPVAAPAAPLLAGAPGAVVGRYIVVLKADQDPVGVAKACAATPEHTYRHALRGFSANLSEDVLARLLADQRVAYIEPDARVWVSDSAGGRVSAAATGSEGQVVPWGVTRVGGSHDGTGRTAWVIDSGIDLNNPDLNVDVARSVSFVTRGTITPQDAEGHGTHVAGTIGALNNGTGVVGVAAGATLVAVRVLDERGGGWNSWIIAGIDYVAAMAAPGDVANLSLGGAPARALDTAVIAAADKGILFAIAAGNERVNAGEESPSRVEHQNVYVVSAINKRDNFAYFSNFGNPPIDYAAPGVNIRSTAIGGGTLVVSGTSSAAPHVAGLLLLGSLHSDGTAHNDPDGTPDPIAHY